MPKRDPVLLPSEPDPAIVASLMKVEHACLATLLLIAAGNVTAWLIPALGRMFPGGWEPMKAESVAATLLSTLCLILSEPGQSKWAHRFSILLAALVTVWALAILLEHWTHLPLGQGMMHSTVGQIPTPTGMTLRSASGFALLGCTMSLARAEGRLLVRLADLLALCVSLIVLVLTSGYFLGTSRFFGISTNVSTSPWTLMCLLLLTVVVVLRRTEDGLFSIFTGHGIGGRLARILAPILLVLPFLREGARARYIGYSQMPAHYVTATLASLAAIVSMLLLLYLAWQINSMEIEIHALSLRDELTGLYNLRGFHLLADQALRLAQRADLPFSVLFIDLDNLKTINDRLGHRTGSTFLTETSEILRANFRETDVLGRIGGDEFAVAGQFSREATLTALQRLVVSCAKKNNEADRQFEISFSVGYATSGELHEQTLDQLLAEADRAMYEAKRVKKIGHDQGGQRHLHGTQPG